jgi:hypothetical protein
MGCNPNSLPNIGHSFPVTHPYVRLLDKKQRDGVQLQDESDQLWSLDIYELGGADAGKGNFDLEGETRRPNKP